MKSYPYFRSLANILYPIVTVILFCPTLAKALSPETLLRQALTQNSIPEVFYHTKINETQLSYPQPMLTKTVDCYNATDKNGLNKYLLIFQTPDNLKGLRILSLSHKTIGQANWIYLPALHTKKMLAFSISETDELFNFLSADATSLLNFLEDYNDQKRLDKTIDNSDCYVIDLIPKKNDKNKIVKIFIQKEPLLLKRLELWQADALQETLTITHYSPIDTAAGKRWVAQTLIHENYAHNKKQEVLNQDFSTDPRHFPADLFNPTIPNP